MLRQEKWLWDFDPGHGIFKSLEVADKGQTQSVFKSCENAEEGAEIERGVV